MAVDAGLGLLGSHLGGGGPRRCRDGAYGLGRCGLLLLLLHQRRFARREEHDHVATLALGSLLDLSLLLKILRHAAQQGFRQGRVLNLPAAEDHRALHLVAGLEKTHSLTDSHVVVVLVDLVAHL